VNSRPSKCRALRPPRQEWIDKVVAAMSLQPVKQRENVVVETQESVGYWRQKALVEHAVNHAA